MMEINMTTEILGNYCGGQWAASRSREIFQVHNSATNMIIGQVPLSTPNDVDEVVQAGAWAYDDWRLKPSFWRVRPGRYSSLPLEMRRLNGWSGVPWMMGSKWDR